MTSKTRIPRRTPRRTRIPRALAPRIMSNKPCYKCGQPGHWARDCTVPKDQWLSKEAAQALKEQATTTTATDGDGMNGDRARPQSATKTKRESTRKPKFTVHEHLLGPDGLIKVYTEFPSAFAAKAKGQGHEEHDVALLIGMYKDWAIKMYPYAPAEQTLKRVDKLGSDKAVKAFTRELHERDFGGGVGDAVEAMERAERGEGEARNGDDDYGDFEYPDNVADDEDDDENVGGAATTTEDVDTFPDDEFEEEDYEFADEDEDAAAAMEEADREEANVAESSDDDEGIALAGAKRGKKAKGSTATTKKAFENLAKKIGAKKTSEAAVGTAPSPIASAFADIDPNAHNSPQRKILRVRPKFLDASDSEDDAAAPVEPTRRRRAVHMHEEDDED